MLSVSSLISSLQSVKGENDKSIRELSNLRSSLSSASDGGGVLYSQDSNAIRSYQSRALGEINQAISQLQKLNGEIDQYIQKITR